MRIGEKGNRRRKIGDKEKNGKKRQKCWVEEWVG
jgi:hypothetical protein